MLIIVLQLVKDGSRDVVGEFADGEHRGAEQQPQEASDLAQQHEHLERGVLLHLMVFELRVENVHQQKVVTESGP